MTEQSLAEVEGGRLTEAVASAWQLVEKAFLKESLPSPVRCVFITHITLIGYSVMGGKVDVGGLGDIPIR